MSRARAAAAAAVAVAAGLALLAGPVAARAHEAVPPAGTHGTAAPAILREVGFDQHLDAAVAADVGFRDEAGRAVHLRDYLDGPPVVLVLAQYRCPNLCPLVLESLAAGLRATGLGAGDYAVVAVGLDPRETPAVAARARQAVLGGYFPAARRGGWHFLTGDDAAIHAVAASIGFRYAYDRTRHEYAHPAGVVVLTPRGRIARYLFGMDFPARDLRLALVEGSHGRIGSVVDHVLLTCYRYDAATGRYTPLVMTLVRIGGVLTIAGLGLMLFLLGRAPRRAAGAAGAPTRTARR